MTQIYLAKDGGQFLEHAAPGVHEVAVGLLGVGASAEILDVPAGSGALAQRLVDSGYQRVACGDVVNGLPSESQHEFIFLDLNAPIDTNRRFDAIFCIECIEHLENPYHLIRSLAKLLKKGGELIISTPNVMSVPARLTYLSAGYFPFFAELSFQWAELRKQEYMGHIMPVPATTLLYAADQCGLTLARWETNGLARRPRLKDRFFAWLARRRADKRYRHSSIHQLLVSDELLFGGILIFKFIKA